MAEAWAGGSGLGLEVGGWQLLAGEWCLEAWGSGLGWLVVSGWVGLGWVGLGVWLAGRGLQPSGAISSFLQP